MPCLESERWIIVYNKRHESLWCNDGDTRRCGDPREDVDHSARIALQKFSKMPQKDWHNMEINSLDLEPRILEPQWRSSDI